MKYSVYLALVGARKLHDVPPNVAPNIDVDREYPDWTGTKYVTSHACWGQPCDPHNPAHAAVMGKGLVQVGRRDVPPNIA